MVCLLSKLFFLTEQHSDDGFLSLNMSKKAVVDAMMNTLSSNTGSLTYREKNVEISGLCNKVLNGLMKFLLLCSFIV